jgi:hypothetical protein
MKFKYLSKSLGIFSTPLLLFSLVFASFDLFTFLSQSQPSGTIFLFSFDKCHILLRTVLKALLHEEIISSFLG